MCIRDRALGFFHAAAHTAEQRPVQRTIGVADFGHTVRILKLFTDVYKRQVTRNANEAAMGLAYELSGGDLAGWVSQMNTLSQRIGTTNSTWTDACGLDRGNTTTAVDMYLILRYLMSFDAFKEISAAPTFTMPAKEKHAKSFVPVSYTHLDVYKRQGIYRWFLSVYPQC